MDDINKNKEYTMADVKMRKLDNRARAKDSFLAFYRLNKGKIIGLVLSIITLILLFKFGLFKTLGIWIVICIGYMVGAYFDRDVYVLQILRKILN